MSNAWAAILSALGGQPGSSSSSAAPAAPPPLASSSAGAAVGAGEAGSEHHLAKGKGKGPKAPGPPPAAKSGHHAAPPAPPPAPPPPPAGKGVGKGRAAGKGKAPAPPKPTARTVSQTKAGARIPPPAALQAPAGASRLRSSVATLKEFQGTMWEGLDPWGLKPEGVLAVNYDRLLAQFLRPDLPPLPAAGARRGRVRVDKIALTDVVARALHLTPELVRQALTEDFDAVSEEQARGILEELLPRAEGEREELEAYVMRMGVGELAVGDRLLHAIASTPSGAQRCRLLGLRNRLPAEVASWEAQVAAVEAQVERLSTSAPLRTLLQSILLVRNIHLQEEHGGFRLHQLVSSISSERMRRDVPTLANPLTGLLSPAGQGPGWARQNLPSTLRLVAEILADTHVAQVQLRAMRRAAVTQLVKKNTVRQLIWEYLDDQGPLEVLRVFPLLRECRANMFDRDLLELLADRVNSLRGRLRRDLQTVLDRMAPAVHVDTEEPPLLGQLWQLGESMERAVICFMGLHERLISAAMTTCRLVGEMTVGMTASKCMSVAEQAMQDFRHLGRLTDEELLQLWDERKTGPETVEREAEWKHSSLRSVKTWQPVETRWVSLQCTDDPNIIRLLRQSPQQAAAQEEPTADRRAKKPKAPPSDSKSSKAEAKTEAQTSGPQRTDLSHGGPEGVYQKDPVTGKWGPRKDGMDGTVALHAGRDSVGL